MTDITPGRRGFNRREDVQDYLVRLGDPPEAISGLLTAVEGLGSIKVYVWRETDDLWGKHYSLYVGHSLLTKEWDVYIEAVYGY